MYWMSVPHVRSVCGSIRPKSGSSPFTIVVTNLWFSSRAFLWLFRYVTKIINEICYSHSELGGETWSWSWVYCQLMILWHHKTDDVIIWSVDSKLNSNFIIAAEVWKSISESDIKETDIAFTLVTDDYQHIYCPRDNGAWPVYTVMVELDAKSNAWMKHYISLSTRFLAVYWLVSSCGKVKKSRGYSVGNVGVHQSVIYFTVWKVRILFPELGKI